jgi:TPR repeat protein
MSRRTQRRGPAGLEKACSARSKEACAEAALVYRKGVVVPEDDTHAARLYAQGCDLGDPIQCPRGGYPFSEGKGVKVDYAMAAPVP